VDQHVLEELFGPFVREPASAGVFTDFDGSISPIVDDPDAAQLIAGAREVLADLAARLGRVGVMSGRPVEFLQSMLPDTVIVSGLYGLQKLERGVRDDHPMGGAWREVTDDIAHLAAARGPEGMRVEDKDLSITLHFRSHPEIADEVLAWANQQAARSGLVVRPAKMSYELHPPIAADKGTALLDVVDDLKAVCFIGDDVGDEKAFDALDRLAERGGVAVVRVTVAGPETPEELVQRADLVVDGPEGALDLLRGVLGGLTAEPVV
jgi:trehalose 6-phosphate phosphatase